MGALHRYARFHAKWLFALTIWMVVLTYLRVEIMIKVNKIKCNECEKIIESKHKHDFVVCDCYIESGGYEGCAVDGGKSYLRRLGNNYTDLSEVVDESNT